jgi:DNA repair exonuclease SbcCD ATPase subunit
MSSSALEKDQEIRDKQAELEESESILPSSLISLAEIDQFPLSLAVSARTSQLYQKAKRVMEEADQALNGADEDVSAEVAAYRQANDLDLEELSARHSASEAQLALTAPIQASVLEAHEKRKKEVRCSLSTLSPSPRTLTDSFHPLTDRRSPQGGRGG